MRVKDEIKQDALFKATVKLVNEIGFASSSVSKIAKEAGISPATVYIYYKNKEDLLVSTYMNIKRDFIQALLKNLDKSLPLRDILKQIWFNLFEFISKNQAEFRFTEQFANSPFNDRVDTAEIDKMLLPLIELIEYGKAQKMIKDVPLELIIAFCFYPMYTLANPKICPGFSKTKADDIETAFTLAWDAIKL